jgi:hypothetical protein
MARRAEEHFDEPVSADDEDVTPEDFRAWLDQLQRGEPVQLSTTAAETLAEARAAGEV